MIATPRGTTHLDGRIHRKPLKAFHPDNKSLRSRPSVNPAKVQSRIEFFEKKNVSTALHSFISTSALPPLPNQTDRKRIFDDSFDIQSNDMKPCAKQVCRDGGLKASRQRVPQTNPHCRGRLSDQICSVPRLPTIDLSVYQSQMSLAGMFPVKKTVETQTSPLNTSQNDCLYRSTSLKDNSRYKRNSRTLLNSVSSSARRTVTNLKRFSGQERIASISSSPTLPHLPVMKSLKISHSKLIESGSKSSSRLKRMGKSLKNLTKRFGSFSSKSSLSKYFTESNSSPQKQSITTLGVETSDSLHCVTIKRPISKKFGFFIAKYNNEVIVSQIAPDSYHLEGLLHKGDIIHSIDGLFCKYMSLSEIYESIKEKDELILQITSSACTNS